MASGLYAATASKLTTMRRDRHAYIIIVIIILGPYYYYENAHDESMQ